MTKILVTTDGSAISNHALLHAQALAGAINTELVVLSVEPDPIPINVPAYPMGEYVYLTEEEIKAEHQAFLDGLKRSLADTPVRVEQARGRSVAEVILDVAQEVGANMIIMSTHGRSGLKRALLGSVAEAVVAHATVPVLLIRGDQRPTPWEARPGNRIS